MNTVSRQVQDKWHVRLLLQWRWLVLVIAIPISLFIEIIEGPTHALHFLDEVIIDGLVLPLSTWLVLTFVARRVVRQSEHEEALEQRQRFMQRLAEHREYSDLTHFLVHAPATLLPVAHASLFVYDQHHAQLMFVTQWNAGSSANARTPSHLTAPVICAACLSAESPAEGHTGDCAFALDKREDSSTGEYGFRLAHDNTLVGALRLRFEDGKKPTPRQIKLLTDLAPEMALALEMAIADSRQAEQLYREAQAYERRRITQQLHDSLAQQVFYLHLGLDQLASDTALLPTDAIQRKAESLRDVAADVYEQVRNNLSILRAWEQVNLTEAVSELARLTARNADLTIAIDVQGEPAWLSPHTCEQIYCIVQETLNNVVKHARAQHVQFELIWLDEHLRISLADDGVGFDPAQLRNEGHYGLALMRETIAALQGVFTLESSPGSGTRVQFSIPLELPDLQQRQRIAWSPELHLALKENLAQERPAEREVAL